MDIVIDLGSGLIKAGRAGESEPEVVETAVVGRPRHQGMDLKDIYVGDEAASKGGVLALSHPVQHGIITNLDDAAALWRHAFEQLAVAPSDCRVLLAEAPLTPRQTRHDAARMLFEDIGVAALRIVNTSVLALTASGLDSGLVLEIGDGVTHAVPVVAASMGALPQAISNATGRQDLAGQDLTDYMMLILTERGHSFTTAAEREIVRDIKERYGLVIDDYEKALAADDGYYIKTYELPDGQIITVDKERFRCPEALFQPALMGKEMPGIHERVHQAIQKTDPALHQQLYYNIILAGGSTAFTGLPERLHTEISALAPQGTKVRVIAPPDRRCSVWIGGSALASQDDFASQWITRAEFDKDPTSIDGT
ncbi:hypothetical protein ACWGDE_18460 [Streptomyces sp. NPDC054956]